jgi:uncharacterized protein involved in outer membrane biogenesis
MQLPSNKTARRALISVAALLLLVLCVLAALHTYLGQDDFRARVQAQASEALGLRVSVERIGVSVWPLPGVALHGVQLATQPPLRAGQLRARPAYTALLQGRMELAAVVVQDAQLSTQGIATVAAAVGKMLQKQELLAQNQRRLTADLPSETEPRTPVQRVLLHDVHLRLPGAAARYSGNVSGELNLSESAPWPLALQVTSGTLAGSTLRGTLTSTALNLGTIDARAGGGTVRGQVALNWRGPVTLNGALQTQGVSLAALLGAQSKLQGRVQASTTLSARVASFAALANGLQTNTRFTVHNALINGIDLQKAVLTIGINRSGQTRLDNLSGNLSTSGQSANLSNLQASSGVLSARGAVSVSPAKALNGRISVDATGIAGHLVGVPLAVGGTVDAPEVMLTRGAMLGAAVGTAVLPGVGTGAGAKIGDSISEGIGKLFGK